MGFHSRFNLLQGKPCNNGPDWSGVSFATVRPVVLVAALHWTITEGLPPLKQRAGKRFPQFGEFLEVGRRGEA